MQLVVRLVVVKPRNRKRKKEELILLAQIDRHGKNASDMQRVFEHVRMMWPDLSFSYTGNVLTFRLHPLRASRPVIHRFCEVVQEALSFEAEMASVA